MLLYRQKVPPLNELVERRPLWPDYAPLGECRDVRPRPGWRWILPGETTCNSRVRLPNQGERGSGVAPDRTAGTSIADKDSFDASLRGYPVPRVEPMTGIFALDCSASGLTNRSSGSSVGVPLTGSQFPNRVMTKTEVLGASIVTVSLVRAVGLHGRQQPYERVRSAALASWSQANACRRSCLPWHLAS